MFLRKVQMDRANHLSLFISLLLVMVLACCATTDGAQELTKLMASDGGVDDYFGYAVSISGNCALVGARGDGDMGSQAGSAYIFRSDGAAWAQETKLTADDGSELDRFGYAVAIDGDYAVVGAIYAANGVAVDAGAAYVFKYDGLAWTQQAKLTASDGVLGDAFGWSVGISGDRVVVGAVSDDDHGTSSGSAYVFKRAGTIWTQEGKLAPVDGAAEDFFGAAVAIDGSYVVAGAYGNDDAGDSSGLAYIYTYNGTAWAQQAKLIAGDGAAGDLFGKAVSISGTHAMVGSSQDDDFGLNSGAVYVFTRADSTWSQTDKLTASDASSGDLFGQAVSLHGGDVMVGASGEQSAYVFQWDGADWTERARLVDALGEPGDIFGYAVAIGTDFGIAGAFGDDDSTGSVYVYDNLSFAIAAVYRFWSPPYARHFYTISQTERDKLLNDYGSIWMYESISSYVFPEETLPGLLPVYRFWSPLRPSHFYTMSETEKDKLIAQYSSVWTYEGPAFYAYPAGAQPADSLPVYRFWSSLSKAHFYTISEAEKDKLIVQYPDFWAYEEIAWYAYAP